MHCVLRIWKPYHSACFVHPQETVYMITCTRTTFFEKHKFEFCKSLSREWLHQAELWKSLPAQNLRQSRPASTSAHLHTQAESGAYLRDSPRVPRLFLYLDHHTPSGQSRVDRVTYLCTDGVHCRESAGTGPVNLKIVQVTGAVPWLVTMDQLMCASLFPRPLLV